MISSNCFKLFDPSYSTRNILPDVPGNYIVALRHNSQLPNKAHLSEKPQMTTFHYEEEKYEVVYVGKSKSLRTRDYKQHFYGTAGNSTLRKSIGCLMGFQQIPRDAHAPSNGKTKFNDQDENALSMWMENNILFFFYANDEYNSLEKELIKTYNPPLNLQGNFNKINSLYRKELLALRKTSKLQQFANFAYVNIKPSQPIEQTIEKKKSSKWLKIFYSTIAVLFVINLYLSVSNSGNHKSNNSELTYTQAQAGVRYYLKHIYLKDPDSYQSIEWGSFGNYDNNNFFLLHKYRAKNSFGGYVVEEKLFVLDKEGNVIKLINDFNDIEIE